MGDNGGVRAVESKLNLRLVTGEFEVLLCLYRNGATRSRELSMSTKVSIANFQIILRRLRDEGIIVSYTDQIDRRVRQFDLAHHVREEFDGWMGSDSTLAALLKSRKVMDVARL